MAPNRVSKKEARWSPFRKTQPSNIQKTLYRLNNGKDTVVAGRGLIATSDIAKGTQILEDEPLLVIDTTMEDESAFFASERADNSQLVQAAISLLNGPTRRMFCSLIYSVTTTLTKLIETVGALRILGSMPTTGLSSAKLLAVSIIHAYPMLS